MKSDDCGDDLLARELRAHANDVVLPELASNRPTLRLVGIDDTPIERGADRCCCLHLPYHPSRKGLPLIEISRSVVRSFRAVLKKIATVLGNREPPAVVLFRTDRMGLHIQARNSQIALEHSLPGSYTAVEEVALPAEALGDFESRKDASVRFQVSKNQVIASWQDKAVPQVKQYLAAEPNRIPKMPALPPSMQRQPVELLKALADASEIAATDSTRFTLTCLQLRGSKNQVVSTDGKQLLLQSGFTLRLGRRRTGARFSGLRLPRDAGPGADQPGPQQ